MAYYGSNHLLRRSPAKLLFYLSRCCLEGGPNLQAERIWAVPARCSDPHKSTPLGVSWFFSELQTCRFLTIRTYPDRIGAWHHRKMDVFRFNISGPSKVRLFGDPTTGGYPGTCCHQEAPLKGTEQPKTTRGGCDGLLRT